MGKKDKKGGTKAAALAAKKAKQENKATKKSKAKAAKLDGSDAEDVDLDEVLAEYQRAQEQFLKITEVAAPAPPKPRAASCFLASPANSNQLLLFGGEYFNGALATFFNDLHVYYIDRDLWKTVTSPNAPLPRSGHAWCRGGNQSGTVFLFGGEFSSPKQGTFYHYNDFWSLEPNAREWTRLEPKGKTPPARSGHRMTYFKQYIVLFGGFQDTASNTKYLADLWLYDTVNFVWFNPTLPPAQLKPEARSSFTLLPHEQGAVLFGGYSRVKATAAASKGGRSGGFSGTKNVLKPMVHQDCFFLRITPPAADAAPNTPPVVRWEKRKKPANTPEPKRAGATMAYHKGRGIMFGGVHDVEESEEGIESEFFNGLFAWNVERNRFFPLTLRKPRQQKKREGGPDERVGRRARGQAREDELLRQLAALETGKSVEDAGEMELDKKESEENSDDEDREPLREMPVTLEPPHPRFNAQLAVQDDVLYIYGGTFEKGDREFTFDDMYAIDLGKMDGCKEVFKRETQDWIESESEDDDEDDEDDDMEDSEDEDEDVEMDDQESSKVSVSKRTKKADEVSNAGTESTESSLALSASTAPTEEEETEAAAPVDDKLPQPRPFESRKDFFQRTTAEWQEVLMESMRFKGLEPEALTIKELIAKAFKLSEEKWWDSREWITALEDEQEAAGISEIISLADRGGAAGASAGARRR